MRYDPVKGGVLCEGVYAPQKLECDNKPIGMMGVDGDYSGGFLCSSCILRAFKHLCQKHPTEYALAFFCHLGGTPFQEADMVLLALAMDTNNSPSPQR